MSNRRTPPASVLEHAALAIAGLGVVTMLSFPAARGLSESFGWLPFWLLALPLTAWAVARGLRSGASDSHVQSQAVVHRLPARRVVSVRGASSKQALRRAA